MRKDSQKVLIYDPEDLNYRRALGGLKMCKISDLATQQRILEVEKRRVQEFRVADCSSQTGGNEHIFIEDLSSVDMVVTEMRPSNPLCENE